MEPKMLSLDCDALEEFRLQLDMLLRYIVEKMVMKGMDTGSITGKIKIELKTTVTDDGEVVRTIRLEPKISTSMSETGKSECAKKDMELKISTSMSETGKSECAKKDMELKFDHNGLPVIGTDNQISMDEILQQKGV